MPVIATNTSANTALIYLNSNSRAQEKSLAKVSSGSRIVRASDDAAGLAVASSLRADVTTLKQAAINAVQARSVLQTADGALARAGDILQRMKALATQAISGSIADVGGRDFIDLEYQQLVTEVTVDLPAQTVFNGTPLLDASYTGGVGEFQVGILATDTIDIDLSTVDLTGLTAVGDVTTAANAATESAALDADIDTISSARATVGAYLSRFEYRGEVIDSAIENLSAAQSAIMDVDLAAEQSNLVSKQVLTEASIAALAQANQMKSSLLSLVR
jgi:flagellin